MSWHVKSFRCLYTFLIASLHSYLALHTALIKYKTVIFAFVTHKISEKKLNDKLENCCDYLLKTRFLKRIYH